MPLTLRLGSYLLQTQEDEELRLLQSAVALLRTVFEDHQVDPDHQTALFFHGRTLPGGPHDFSVVHRGEQVVLSDFTFETRGPKAVTVPLATYAREVSRYARQVLGAEPGKVPRPDWQARYVDSLRQTTEQLTALTEQVASQGAQIYPRARQAFQELHGHQKRPLELQVREVLDHPAPWTPIRVVARAVFGPLRLHERIPVRLNGGDTIVATVDGFRPEGVHLTLAGIGHGGVCPGDRLIGLQLFYP